MIHEKLSQQVVLGFPPIWQVRFEHEKKKKKRREEIINIFFTFASHQTVTNSIYPSNITQYFKALTNHRVPVICCEEEPLKFDERNLHEHGRTAFVRHRTRSRKKPPLELHTIPCISSRKKNLGGTDGSLCGKNKSALFFHKKNVAIIRTVVARNS